MAVLVLVCGVVRLVRGGASCLRTRLVYVFACGSPGLGVRQSGLVYAAVRVCMSAIGHWHDRMWGDGRGHGRHAAPGCARSLTEPARSQGRRGRSRLCLAKAVRWAHPTWPRPHMCISPKPGCRCACTDAPHAHLHPGPCTVARPSCVWQPFVWPGLCVSTHTHLVPPFLCLVLVAVKRTNGR